MTNNFNALNTQMDLFRVIKQFQHETFAKLNCMRIGIIDKIISSNEVQCSITNKQFIKTNKDGSSVWASYPPILAKVYYAGSAQSNITYPLTIGTPCLLLFNDREFTSFFTNGEINPLSDNRMHALDDCVCVPLSQNAISQLFEITSLLIEISGKSLTLKSSTSITLDAPDVSTTGNLNVATGYSGIVPCGAATLTITNGIITGVS